MAKTAKVVEPTSTRDLTPDRTACPYCGGPLRADYANRRTVHTLAGVTRLNLTIRRCHHAPCPAYKRPYRPEAEGAVALPRHEFGLDVIALIGRLRYAEHRSVPEIRAHLVGRGVSVSERAVTNLLDRYDELLAVALADDRRLTRILAAQGKVVLALDGLQPDAGHEALWVLRDVLSGEILLARSLLSARQRNLAELLSAVKAASPVPVAAVVSDGQHSIRKAVTVRFETPPGHQAQADWAFAGKLADAAGTPRSVYVFTFVLSFSRLLFLRCTTSMNLAALVDCHRHAFAELGGWPREILYDNMKQVRLGPGRWNEGFLDFARHYGFTPKTHRPYRPRTKGKVERAVEYVKDNFLLGRTFADLDDLNAQARTWLANTANVRVHATTGQRPIDLLPREALTPAGTVADYQFLDLVRRTASFESVVHFRGSRYSVPPAFAGQPVEVAAVGGQVVVRAGDAVIAEHREAARSGQCVVARDHIEELWKITAEQIKPPADAPRPLAAEAQVRRVDLRTFEEVSQ